MCSPVWKVIKSCSVVFIVLNLPTHLTPLPFLFPLITWFFWWPARSWGFLGYHPKSTYKFKRSSLWMTEDFSHSGNFKGFRKSVPKVGTKTKCVFLIINHSIAPLPNLWLRTIMICCFSQPCGLGVWAGLVWSALLLCVTSVGVAHSSVFSWCLGWVRQDNRVSTHWSQTLIVFSVASL